MVALWGVGGGRGGGGRAVRRRRRPALPRRVVPQGGAGRRQGAAAPRPVRDGVAAPQGDAALHVDVGEHGGGR